MRMPRNRIDRKRFQNSLARTRLFWTLLLLSTLLTSGFLPAQHAAATAGAEGNVAISWFELSLKLVRETPGYTPPVAAQSFGYLGITLYETVRPGMQEATTLAGQLNELDRLPRANPHVPFHWPTAANAAMAAAMRRFFPTATPENLALIDALEARFAAQYAGEVDAATSSLSRIWGRSIAIAIFNWSKRAGGHAEYGRNLPESYP